MKEQLTSKKDRLASIRELLDPDIGKDVLTSDKGLPLPTTNGLLAVRRCSLRKGIR